MAGSPVRRSRGRVRGLSAMVCVTNGRFATNVLALDRSCSPRDGDCVAADGIMIVAAGAFWMAATTRAGRGAAARVRDTTCGSSGTRHQRRVRGFRDARGRTNSTGGGRFDGTTRTRAFTGAGRLARRTPASSASRRGRSVVRRARLLRVRGRRLPTRRVGKAARATTTAVPWGTAAAARISPVSPALNARRPVTGAGGRRPSGVEDLRQSAEWTARALSAYPYRPATGASRDAQGAVSRAAAPATTLRPRLHVGHAPLYESAARRPDTTSWDSAARRRRIWCRWLPGGGDDGSQ